MAELPPSSSSFSSAAQVNRASNSEASSSSSSSTMNQFRVEEDEEDRLLLVPQAMEEHQHQYHEVQQNHQERNGVVLQRNLFDVDDSSVIQDDTWSCVIVVLTFWFFVSMTLILGVYGPATMRIGPNSSILIEPSPIFVQSIKVRELDDSDLNTGLMLYGFYKSPPLDVVKTWSLNRTASIPVDTHKEWSYYLNEGSEISIWYSMNSQGSSVFLIIALGSDGLAQWLDDPTYPNTTLSWNVIQGTGTVSLSISQAATYYVAVGNLNSEDIEVELEIRVKSLMFNTTEAYYGCDFSDDQCSIQILFPNGNALVLTSADLVQGSSSNEWYVKLTYGPRWSIYIVGIAGMTTIMLVTFNFLNKYRCGREQETGPNFVDAQPERDPLLSYKDDDASSWGSSYDSQSSKEEDLNHEFVFEGKTIRDGEDGNNTRRLCAICFDAPRDCFFLPCGHCVACFACGTRIAEAGGTCPVCRRNMRKVRNIFTV